jgi:glyoxylase-like metal-dependent hydrolase (beta-lactamase superfamily II)
MQRDRSRAEGGVTESLSEVVFSREGGEEAVPVGRGIFMSKGVANTYRLITSDGDLMINTGLHFEAPQIEARFSQVSTGPLRVIVFTQGHPDHVGGWSHFDAPGVETIAQANHADVREYWHRLQPFYARRIAKLWARFTGGIDTAYQPPEPILTTTFIDSHAFDLGDRRFELYSTTGGETTDSLAVWLPEERIVFIGNLLGPMFGHVPNLYTVRGDKIRSAISFIHSVDRILALEPETLANGHDVFRGADLIRETMTKVRDATTYLRDRTIDGMNAGMDLWTLMSRVTLPSELALPQLHGKTAWIVRAIWEEHVGWFRYESTTELYDAPASAVWSDLIELAGGIDALTERARLHAEHAHPLQALHLTDMVLSFAPDDRGALRVKRTALDQLLSASGRENFSEVQWLESEIHLLDAALG